MTPRAPSGTSVAYRRPASPILQARCTKEFARGMIRRGIYVEGCIWVPGSLNDRPDLGDLFAPDPDWKSPTSSK